MAPGPGSSTVRRQSPEHLADADPGPAHPPDDPAGGAADRPGRRPEDDQPPPAASGAAPRAGAFEHPRRLDPPRRGHLVAETDEGLLRGSGAPFQGTRIERDGTSRLGMGLTVRRFVAATAGCGLATRGSGPLG